MRILLILLASIATASISYAQSGTVRKVKGRSAIIKFDKKPNFRKGDRIDLGGGQSRTSGMSSRDYSLALSAAIESSTQKVASVEVDTDAISLATLFMFNKGMFEYGAGFTYTSIDVSGSETTEYSISGAGEYNFIKNTPGTKFVPSLQGLVGIANYEAGSASGNGLSYGFGGRLKMFPWNDSFAIVAAAGISGSTIDVGGGAEIERTSTDIRVGIQGYF